MNYYTVVTAQSGLRCTKGQAAAIDRLLVTHDEQTDNEPCGFSFVYEAGEGYLRADESGDWGEIPPAALKKIGALITKNKLPYLECGVAFTAYRAVAGSTGGTAFRILPDGTLHERIETWPPEVADPNENWRNDAIQLPRLLAEINATIALTPAQRTALSATMDLDWPKIANLFARADAIWQDIKRRTP